MRARTSTAHLHGVLVLSGPGTQFIVCESHQGLGIWPCSLCILTIILHETPLSLVKSVSTSLLGTSLPRRIKKSGTTFRNLERNLFCSTLRRILISILFKSLNYPTCTKRLCYVSPRRHKESVPSTVMSSSLKKTPLKTTPRLTCRHMSITLSHSKIKFLRKRSLLLTFLRWPPRTVQLTLASLPRSKRRTNRHDPPVRNNPRHLQRRFVNLRLPSTVKQALLPSSANSSSVVQVPRLNRTLPRNRLIRLLLYQKSRIFAMPSPVSSPRLDGIRTTSR